MKHLVPAGLVISQRGVQGGYRIARDAAEINVAHVVEALEGPIALTACLDEGDDQCCIEHTCPMSSHWSKINTAVRQALEGVTLASMVHTDVIFGLPVPPPPSAHTDGYGHKA
jgi:Rrf2 family protein